VKITIYQPQKHGVLIPINFSDGSTYYPECWHEKMCYTEESLDWEGERVYHDSHCGECGAFIETLKVEFA
jgi:hypothetical protein